MDRLIVVMLNFQCSAQLLLYVLLQNLISIQNNIKFPSIYGSKEIKRALIKTKKFGYILKIPAVILPSSASFHFCYIARKKILLQMLIILEAQHIC